MCNAGSWTKLPIATESCDKVFTSNNFVLLRRRNKYEFKKKYKIFQSLVVTMSRAATQG